MRSDWTNPADETGKHLQLFVWRCLMAGLDEAKWGRKGVVFLLYCSYIYYVGL